MPSVHVAEGLNKTCIMVKQHDIIAGTEEHR